MSTVPAAGAPLEGSEDTASPAVLEREVPLSQSVIWKRQQEFYAQRGLKAWTEDQVPAYITNNPFITEIYASIVFAFLRDCIALSGQEARPVSPKNPLRILELGAGTGKFSYLFLRRLTALLRDHGIDPGFVRCCITDGADTLLHEWRRNDYLAGFVTRGMLQFEVFSAGEEIESPFLAGRNDVLPPSQPEPAREPSPLVVIANYVFDSLPNDAFVIRQGQISEALITTTASGSPGQPSSAGAGPARQPDASKDSFSSLQFSFTNAASPQPRYADETWNKILQTYRDSLPAATVLFPCGTLAVLRDLARFSDGRMLVLCADKGYAHEEALPLAPATPALEFHAANCFSQMVNFDAIAKYFAATGGEALLPDKHFASLNICAFLAAGAGEDFSSTRAAYRGTQEAFGPDDLFTLFSWLNAHMEEMTVPQILSALRLTRWDTTALMRLFPALARQLRGVSAERLDLRDAVLRTWANHYPVSHGDNALAFQCGVILLELRFFEEAAAMFRASQKLFARSAPTSYNLGLCAQGLGHPEEALAAMVEATNLDPNFQPAQEARRKLEHKSSAL